MTSCTRITIKSVVLKQEREKKNEKTKMKKRRKREEREEREETQTKEGRKGEVTLLCEAFSPNGKERTQHSAYK